LLRLRAPGRGLVPQGRKKTQKMIRFSGIVIDIDG